MCKNEPTLQLNTVLQRPELTNYLHLQSYLTCTWWKPALSLMPLSHYQSEKIPRCPSDRRLDGPQSRFCTQWWRKNLYDFSENQTPKFPVVRSAAYHYIVNTVEYLIYYYTEKQYRLLINNAFPYNWNARCGLNIAGHMPELILPPYAVVLQRTSIGTVAGEGRWPVISLIGASH